MATKKDKSPKEEFKKKSTKSKKPKTAPKQEKPYTGGKSWCGTMSRNRRRWGGGGTPSSESW